MILAVYMEIRNLNQEFDAICIYLLCEMHASGTGLQVRRDLSGIRFKASSYRLECFRPCTPCRGDSRTICHQKGVGQFFLSTKTRRIIVDGAISDQHIHTVAINEFPKQLTF